MKMKFIGNDGNSVQKVMYRSGSNWTFRKRENEQIRRENNKFVNCIKDNLIKPDEFKKKMNKEIREYLDRKNQIRKCKYISKG